MNNTIKSLVDKVTNSLGRFPDTSEINISTVIEGEKTFLVVEHSKEYKNKLKDMVKENDFTVFYQDFDSTISELRKEIQYVEDRYNAPVEILDTLVREVNSKLIEQEVIISELHRELNSLSSSQASSVEVNKDITTPFRDDIEPYDDCYREKELGEVEDTFNVEINRDNGNPITLTRRVIRSSRDDGSYLQSMIDVLSKLRNDK